MNDHSLVAAAEFSLSDQDTDTFNMASAFICCAALWRLAHCPHWPPPATKPHTQSYVTGGHTCTFTVTLEILTDRRIPATMVTSKPKLLTLLEHNPMEISLLPTMSLSILINQWKLVYYPQFVELGQEVQAQQCGAASGPCDRCQHIPSLYGQSGAL